MATRMTQKDYFEKLLTLTEVAKDKAMVEFIEGRIAQLEKKASAEKKPTKTQIANEGAKVAMLAEMEKGKLYTVTDMIKTLPSCAEFTNQKVSAILKQLVEDKAVSRIEDKRKAYFSLA